MTIWKETPLVLKPAVTPEPQRWRTVLFDKVVLKIVARQDFLWNTRTVCRVVISLHYFIDDVQQTIKTGVYTLRSKVSIQVTIWSIVDDRDGFQ